MISTSRDIRDRLNKALGLVMRETRKYRKPKQRPYTQDEQREIMWEAGVAITLAFERFPIEMQSLIDSIDAQIRIEERKS